jgi:molybdate transport system substrate-binding protein
MSKVNRPHGLTTIIGTVAMAGLVATTPLLTHAQSSTPRPVRGQITVYAAASLRDAFTQIGKNFEAAHPGTKLTFNFAGSQQLAEQIGYGAPADVFASANTRLMDAVIKTTRVTSGTQQIFVRNRLIVVVPSANRADIRRLEDLRRANLKVVLAAKAVPVGTYSLDFLSKASAKPQFGVSYRAAVLANVVSYEEDVRAVFSKVSLGEADAGIVYSSDVVADKRNAVRTIVIPDDLNTIAVYPIAPLNDSENRPLAQAFVNYVLSAKGQAVLKTFGFVGT